MGMAKKIRIVLIERNMNITQLANLMGTKVNNLSNKLTRDNFTEKDLRDIAEALDCDFEGTFILRDSKKRI